MNAEKIIRIRPARMEDLDRLLVFEQGVITAERPFDATLKADPIRYYDIDLMIRAQHIQILVAELEGQLIGSGYARKEEAKPYLRHAQYAYLGFMYVDPAHRGKGVNALIMDELKAWAIANDLHELRLDVYHPNESAIRAYEKAGFVKHMISMRKGV